MNLIIFKKIGDIIDKIVGYTCICFAIGMTISTLCGIFLRYITSNPLSWTEEFARYAMIWMGLLAISMGVKRYSHLGVNFFFNLLHPSIRKILMIIINILIIFFFAIMLIYGWEMTKNAYNQVSPALKMHMSYVLVVVPVTSAISIYHSLILLWESFQLTESNTKPQS